MRRSLRALTAAGAAAALASSGWGASAAIATPASPAADERTATWLVLASSAADTGTAEASVAAAGGRVTAVNRAIGLLSVTSGDAAFATKARGRAGVQGVATNRSVGSSPRRAAGPDPVEQEQAFDRSRANGTGKAVPPAPAGHDPLDGLLWGMKMIHAYEAHATETGDRGVTVGVLDTGIQADHPDLRANVDVALSRNFVTDLPDIDGPCEVPSCKDPATVDEGGHGTHVAGTIAAARNGLGVSGVAPDVRLVNVRGGQDSGYFFLKPVVDALTYSGDVGLDVVNMSFYVDPWLYNCQGGAPEDSPGAAADQALIIEGMNRALEYAHDHGVTLVAALGNDHDDLSDPRNDTSSPDFGADPYERTISNATCVDLPVEGPNVLGVSALGPSGQKSDYSNWATDLRSGELELSAPGGWYRDGLGTDSFRTNGNLVLSTVPLVSLRDTGEVDKNGNVTKDGRLNGVLKQCDAGGSCGYYAWYQGTSMAAPHASGVAALAVSAHGTADPAHGGLTMAPSAVTSLLTSTATDHVCPIGGQRSYVPEGRSTEFDATCVGTPELNSFYGHGIVDALRVVQ